jgi:hypothetical protein
MVAIRIHLLEYQYSLTRYNDACRNVVLHNIRYCRKLETEQDTKLSGKNRWLVTEELVEFEK